MFTHYRTQGFVLKKEDRGEADRLFTFFTEDFGKLSLLAKAERKIGSKLRAGLGLFYLSEIEFIQGKRQKTLTDSILINGFPNLRNNFSRLKIAYAIGEVLDKLVRGEEPEGKIWVLLDEVFAELNKKSEKPENQSLVYYYFLWNLLSFLGYQLEVYQCALCQKRLKPESIFFSPRNGGIICADCRKTAGKSEEISPDTVKILRILLERDIKTLKRLRIGGKELESIAFISKHYLSDVLEKTQ